LLDEWIYGHFCKLLILSRLVAQIITLVHAAPRLTNLFPKEGTGESADIVRRVAPFGAVT
jgi:hypothetical protein